MVPRLRTCGSPIPPASWARAGMVFCTSAERATSACVVMAPIVMPPPSTFTPLSAAMPPRSTRSLGCASRCFSVGMRVMPPATILASLLPASRLAASAAEAGRWYPKSCMVHPPLLCRDLGWRGLYGLPDLERRCRHRDVLHAERRQRIDDRVDDGGRRADGTDFADALG